MSRRIVDLPRATELPNATEIILPIVEDRRSIDGAVLGVSQIPVLDLIALIVKEVEKSGIVELIWSEDGIMFRLK